MRKRSVIIANRHNTSISLEDEFMQELELIAIMENKTVNQLVTEIDSERTSPNLSSAIRIYILEYIKQKNTEH
ncbi:MAG: ribbon-helix-helix domain-containing protein [Alphaproteobacteria bacterium]|nr:ribbon-helix-helix domain-containing protein [Alphaproteobacteria bacterium]